MDESRLFQDQLLTTKFYIPTSSQTVIARARLFALLDEGLTRPLTLVSAPAGFGKSTLVSTWVHSRPAGRPLVAWVTLDEQDNDPQRFWRYVLTAFEHCQPGTFRPFLTALRRQPFSALHSMLIALLNTLVEHSKPQLLVLDDYHVVTEQTIHAALVAFIERLPPHIHVVLITRADLPVNLSRLQGHDQVFEIRTDSLSYTLEETDAFLRQVMGIPLEPDAVEQITARTEGWPMGLQLVGLSLRGHITPRTLLTQLSGTQRYILDYLTEEVLQQQPPEIQTFLLQTSILAQLTSSLCDMVTGQAVSRFWRRWSERMFFWCPWMVSGAGIGTMHSLRRPCVPDWNREQSDTRSMSYIDTPVNGMPGTTMSGRQSSMPYRLRTGLVRWT